MQRGVWSLLVRRGLARRPQSRNRVAKKAARDYAVIRCQAFLRGEVAALDAELAEAVDTLDTEVDAASDEDEAAVADGHLQDALGLDWDDTQQLAHDGIQG